MRKKLSILVFVLGIIAGLLFGAIKLKASSPEGEVSPGQASVFYDEHWQAIEAIVSNADTNKYAMFNNFYHDTPTAAKMKKETEGWEIKTFPKMVVTKWRVHGHIHFAQ